MSASPIPAGSTPLLEFDHAVHDTPSLPKPAAERDELTYLRVFRDRSRKVVYAMKRLLRDREADDCDVMAMVVRPELGDAELGYRPEPTL